MSTITHARPSTRLANDGERPTVNHYHAKADMTRAIITGEKILALCGNISSVGAQGGGNMTRLTRGVLIVCEGCKSAYDAL